MSEKMIVACPECQTRFVAPLEKFLPDGRKVRCAKCGHSWFQRVEVTGEEPVIAAPEPARPAESIMDRATRVTTDSVIERADERRVTPEGTDSGATGLLGPATGVAATAGATEGDDAWESDERAAAMSDRASSMSDTARNHTPKKRRSFLPRALFYTAATAIIAGALGYFFKDEISAKVPAITPQLAAWHDTVDGIVSKAVPANRSLRIENVTYNLTEENGERALLLSAEVINDSGSIKDAPKLTVTVFGSEGAVLNTLSLAPEDLATKIPANDRTPYFLRMPYPPEELERVEVDFADDVTAAE